MDATNDINNVNEAEGDKMDQTMNSAEIIEQDGDNPFGYRTALILSAIAYCTDIEKQLQLRAPYWKPVWLPSAEYDGNFAYVASNGNQYMVAIRGSVLSFSWEAFQDWFEQDFNIITQVPWQYPASSANPQISQGASGGLSDLQNLVSTDGIYLLDFLMDNAVANNKQITVTGHSLGGALATVFAPWLDYRIKTAGKTPPTIQVMTYAAPAIGNPAFAEAYDSLFENNSWRYYNSIDIVPRCAASIAGIGSLYNPHPQASQISVTYDNLTVTLQEAFEGIALIVPQYQQTNQNSGSMELNKSETLYDNPQSDTIEIWFDQAGDQHASGNYLQLIGLSPVICSRS